MTITAQMTTTVATSIATALTWIVDRNAAYRQAHKLQSASHAQLKDMGMTRAEADTAFYTRSRGHRHVDQPRIVLTGGL